jgi:hypothetical protein
VDDHERSITEIERQHSIITQQYLVGQVQSHRAMIDLHEKEMVLLWGAMLALMACVVFDNTRLRKQIKELSNA